jgi:hypothetical protein
MGNVYVSEQEAMHVENGSENMSIPYPVRETAMKKLLSFGLLAVCAVAISEQQAHAWVNSRFSVGLNWHLQSANNSTLWGLWRNGQIPGPDGFGPGPGPGPGVPPPGYYPPPVGPQPFPWLGAQGSGMPPVAYQNGAAPQTMPMAYQPMYPQAQPEANPYQSINQVQQYYAPSTSYYGSNPYQPVSYQPQAYGYNYYAPSYYVYPFYNYSAPYYWYGYR